MQGRFAGLVGRIDVAAQAERNGHGLEHHAFIFHDAPVAHTNLAACFIPALVAGTSLPIARRQHQRCRPVRHHRFGSAPPAARARMISDFDELGREQIGRRSNQPGWQLKIVAVAPGRRSLCDAQVGFAP